MPACSRRLKVVGTLGKCGGSLFSWPSAVAAWTNQRLGQVWHGAEGNQWSRPRVFGRAATAPAAERARNNASRFSDRRFVAGLIAVGRDNFGQSQPWWVSDPAQA